MVASRDAIQTLEHTDQQQPDKAVAGSRSETEQAGQQRLQNAEPNIAAIVNEACQKRVDELATSRQMGFMP